MYTSPEQLFRVCKLLFDKWQLDDLWLVCIGIQTNLRDPLTNKVERIYPVPSHVAPGFSPLLAVDVEDEDKSVAAGPSQPGAPAPAVNDSAGDVKESTELESAIEQWTNRVWEATAQGSIDQLEEKAVKLPEDQPNSDKDITDQMNPVNMPISWQKSKASEEVADVPKTQAEDDDQESVVSVPEAAFPAPKRRKLDDLGEPTDIMPPRVPGKDRDSRCVRCKVYGQICVHGTVNEKGDVPTSCVGCTSVRAQCSFEHLQPRPAKHGQGIKPELYPIDRSWIGFRDKLNKKAFEAFIDKFIIAGLRSEQWKEAALAHYELIAAESDSLVGNLYFTRAGHLNIDFSH